MQAAYVGCAARAVLACPSGEPAVLCRQDRADYEACRTSTAATPDATCPGPGTADAGVADAGVAGAGVADVGAADVGVDTGPTPSSNSYRFGSVVAQGISSFDGTRVYFAEFVANEGDGCNLRTIGPWRIHACESPSTRTFGSAGVIRFSSGVVLEPSGGSRVYFQRYDRTVWNPGDAVGATATGTAVVPAFERSLPYPTPLGRVRTVPGADSDGLFDLHRARLATITWPAGEGLIWLRLAQDTSDFRYVEMQAFLDRAAGQYVIPADVMAHLYHHEAGISVDISVSAVSTTEFMAGTWPVRFSVMDRPQKFRMFVY
ncbi:MAG: hypothetical protein Q8S73_26960 [Deltaproteobacteria bacterium]|nr:hypothetical protein [Deltaproteobacteria bacterium]